MTNAADIQMSQRRFPQELYDEIMNYLWDDKPTLSNCSLVCHAWLPTTRLHLFRVIHVMLRYGRAREGDSTPKLIQNTCPSLVDCASYVRELVIYQRYLGTPSFPEWLGMFKDVEHLRIEEVGMHGLPDAYRMAITAAFPRVNTLHLVAVRFYSLQDLLQILQGYPHLSTIHLDHCRAPDSTQQNLRGGMPINIVDLALCFNRMPVDDLMDALSKPPFTLRLQRLRLLQIIPRQGASDASILQYLVRSRSLEELTITVKGRATMSQSPTWRSFFEQTQRFSTLRLCGLYFPSLRNYGVTGGTEEDLSVVPRTLSHINAVQLQRIVFDVMVHGLDGLLLMDWRLVDELLASLAKKNPRLSVVVEVDLHPNPIYAPRPPTLEEVAESILALLEYVQRAGAQVEVVAGPITTCC